MAILLDMTRSHVPVLAGELIDLTAPAPGEKVVDCTFGGGGHARLMADRIGPAGTLVCVDRDPAAEERFEELAAEVPCDTRFLRMDYVDALKLLENEGFSADLVFFDLGISSMQVDTRERGFSYSYDAPLDMRMDPTTVGPAARDIVNALEERRLAKIFATYGEEPNARAIAREIVRRREREPLQTTGELVEAIEAALPAAVRRKFGGRLAGEAGLPGDPDRRERRAGRPRRTRCPRRGACSRPGGRLAAISFHSLEDRRVKRFLADRARGCICPPDLPVCGCGRTPEAELLTRRAVAPTPGEVADNPRSASGRLRAARRIDGGEGLMAAHPRPRAAHRRPSRPPRAGPRPRRRTAAKRASAQPRGAWVLDKLLPGRVWIGLVFVLLAGIVFFNVDLLQMNREIARTADRAAAVKTRERAAAHRPRPAGLQRAHPAGGGAGRAWCCPRPVRCAT